MQRLELEVVGHTQKTGCPSSNFELPEDLLAFVRIYSNSERSFSVCLMMYCITNTVTSL